MPFILFPRPHYELLHALTLRYSEIRLLQWRQLDLGRRVLTVGDSKTEAGRGREIPLTSLAYEVLTFWANNFPLRKPNHFVFPAEQYGGRGKDDYFGFEGQCVYNTAPSLPIGSWKEAWEAAKVRAGVECRFHDLRHTACTRLLEAGVSHPVVAEIVGWSASTAIQMIKEVYGQIGISARRKAIDQFESFMAAQRGAQKGAQRQDSQNETVQ